MMTRLQRLVERLEGYLWWQVAIELLLIWLVVFLVVRFVQGTRAAGALKSTLLLVIVTTFVVRILAQPEQFARIKYLYDSFLTLLAITMIVIFQPELRRGLIRLGETPILRRAVTSTDTVVDALVDAAVYLSKARFGALVVIDRESGLKGLTEGGTPINGRVSARLLQTIFFPGSALHDLAVVIRGGEVVAAGVQLPLAEPEDMPDPSLGSRHRAAVGLTKECNALVMVISEETGSISLAERGRLFRNLAPDQLRDELARRLRKVAVPAAARVNGAAMLGGPENPLGETGEHATLADRAGVGFGGEVSGDTMLGVEAISERAERAGEGTSVNPRATLSAGRRRT